MALPKLNLNKNKNKEYDTIKEDVVVFKGKSKKDNKTHYTLKLIEEGFAKNANRGILGINHISFDALRVAPEDFMDKYQSVVQEITRYIQNNLSQSDQSSLISRVRNNPVLQEEKESALNAINAEYIKFDSHNNMTSYMTLSNLEKRLVVALVANEIIGLGPLEPLFQDYRIREIICNGPFDIQVEIDGVIEKIPCLRFRDKNHLQDLINRLYNSVNKELSRSNPLERARLFDNSRVFAAHDVVAPKGPNLNIRRHTDDWVDPDALLKFKTGSEEVFEWLGNCVNAGFSMLIVGGTGSGKALPHETRITTPEGYSRIGDIKVGDIVIDSNGKNTKVLGVYEQGEKEIFKLHLNNNISIECCSDHNWLLSDGTVATTKELYKKEKKGEIPLLSNPIKFNNKKSELPIHPYGLGLWLSGNECYSETVSDIEKYAKINSRILQQNYIPEEYETTDIRSRLWLIKGLMKNRKVDKHTGDTTLNDLKDKETKNRLLRIISSLGYFITSIREDSITFKDKTWFEKNKKQYPRSYRIKSITKSSKKIPMRCISVDNPLQTYLCTDSNIVTHNTTLLGALTGFFPNNKRIVTIERNIEMKGCPSKLFAAPMEVVPPKSGSSQARGITMADLVEASTQQRPDIIILGETTGPEAYDILNAANSGHQAFTTIHANSAQDSMQRLVMLTSQTGLITGKAVFDLIAAAIDIVVVVSRFTNKDGARKITSICEVGISPEVNPKNKELYLPVKPIWVFEEDKHSGALTHETRGTWKKVGEISKERQIKHGLDLEKMKTLEELSELY